MIKNNIHNNPELSYHKFCWYFTIAMFVGCNLINIDKFVPWFILNDKIKILGLLAFFFIAWALFLIFFLLICHRKTTKFFSVLLCILSTIVVYFVAKYDISVDRTMIMNAIYTDQTEVYSLLSWQMLPFLFFVTLVPMFLIIKIKIIYPPKYLLKSLKIIVMLIIAVILVGYLQYQNLHRAGNLSHKKIIYSVIPLNYIRSSFSALNHSLIKPTLSQRKKNIEITGKVTKTENLIVVLAIGETSRQKNFSLYGYERLTNPLLSKQKNLHILNGKARLGSTLYALPEILLKNDIPLTALTHKLQIPTACYVNYTLHDNCQIPGEIKVTKCQRKNCFDDDTIPYLQQHLIEYKSGLSLAVIHIGGGSHGPSYHERYPDEFKIFKPICQDADVVNQCSRDQIYNTFDNTILFVDYVVDKMIKILDQSKHRYVFIYLSDHGESLLEGGRIFHGTPPGIPLPVEQSQIPLLIKASFPITIKNFSEYPQPYVYDTIIDLLNIETSNHDKDNSFIIKNSK